MRKHITVVASVIAAFVGLVPAAHGASAVTRHDRATYVGLRYAAKQAGLPVGEKLPRHASARAHGTAVRALRARFAERRRQRELASGGAGGVLAAIRACESGNDYAKDTGNSFYGAYQFTVQTWLAYGGVGMPHTAPPGVQDRVAARLLAAHGVHSSASWPNCP